MEIKSSDKVLIVGVTGSGKTTLAKALINSCKQYNFVLLDSLYDYDTLNKNTNVKIININHGDQQRFIEIIKSLFGKVKCMLVVDEADAFMPSRINLDIWIKRLIHISRHVQLGYLFITRRLSNLHTDAVSQANKIFIFKLWSRADVDYLRQCGLPLSDEMDEILLNLKQYEFVSIDITNNEIMVCDPI